MSWLNPLNAGTQGENLDTQVAWMQVRDGELTPEQQGMVQSQFRRHKAALANGVVGYMSIDYTLPDGTRMHVQSNSGIHQVTVWPHPPHPIVLLPHGFCVVTTWQAPVMYGKSGADWGVRQVGVPQAIEPILTDNYIVKADDKKMPLLVPLVRQRRALWGNTMHVAHDFGTSETPVAADLFIADDPDNLPAEVHSSADNKIYDPDGTLLYTMLDTGSILADGSDLIHYEPAATDTRGTTLLLQSWRHAVISPTFEIEQYRICIEVLQRTSKAVYAAIERNVADLVVQPTGNSAVTTSSSSGPTLDGEVPNVNDLKYIYVSYEAASQYAQGGIHWGVVMPYPEIIGSVTSFSTQAIFEKQTQSNGVGNSVDRIITLPAEAGMDHVAWRSQLNYPDTTYWRAGYYHSDAGYAPPPFVPLAHWETDYYEIQRVDAKHDRICTPKVWLDLQWAPAHEFVIFEGTGEGHLTGVKKHDTKSMSTNGAGMGFIDEITIIWSAAAFASSHGNWEYDSNVAASAPANGEFNALAKPFNDAGGTPKILYISQDVDTGLSANLHYDYTSRHIIDFDARSQFYAAIRVEVQCTGATWIEDTSTERGHLINNQTPTYTVTISFEWCWANQTHSLQLATATCTRPGFEFQQLEHFNVYRWPNDGEGTVYYMPPPLAPPADAASQLVTIMGQQGTNPNYAGADVLQHGADSISTRGIEFSTEDNSILRGAPKWVPGMLYARTFKLADLPEALWLLRATKCDAPFNNDTSGALPAWYYMPDLGALIANTTFHIELRDGVQVTWSTEIPTADGSPPPDENHRDISIYRV